ncbi:uncharacterized protein [Epargyreus clarus]|uniref:uncharacterized protein n=1 Tax=Epargyreus clarus TaxID=520877 RepID=UPI003C2F09D2
MAFIGPMSDISDNRHSLLEPPSPAYTNVTVRRAFIVWMYCGQRNKFKDVCNYFHFLEALEDQLPPEGRALSRHHEFNLFSNSPPTSTYMIDHFPQLYKESCIERQYISKVEEIRNEKCVFKLEGFNEIAPKKGTSTQEIVEASRMIRKFCRIQMISLKKFLEEFKTHARKCDLKYTVNNVAFYIKRKMVQAEIELEANYPKTLGFLNSGSVEDLVNDAVDNTVINNEVNDVISDSGANKALDNNIKPIKILQKGAVDALEITKIYWNDSNTINNTAVTKEIGLEKETYRCENTHFPKNDNISVQNTEFISIDDFTEDNLQTKKERRFSGSRFMKIELEKFRKI